MTANPHSADEQAEYKRARAQIMENAYNDLIELVSEYGHRELKDRMWALVRRTAASVTEAFEASRPSGDRKAAHR